MLHLFPTDCLNFCSIFDSEFQWRLKADGESTSHYDVNSYVTHSRHAPPTHTYTSSRGRSQRLHQCGNRYETTVQALHYGHLKWVVISPFRPQFHWLLLCSLFLGGICGYKICGLFWGEEKTAFAHNSDEAFTVFLTFLQKIFMKLQPGCCSCQWNGREISHHSSNFRSGIRRFCWRSRGANCSYSAQLNGHFRST